VRLAGKIAIVTGAAGKVGRATALRFGQEGAKVVVSDLAAEASEDVAQAIVAGGAEAVGLRADVTSADDLKRLALRSHEAFGPATVVCNCAGARTEARRPLAEVSEDAFRRAVDVNLKGAWMIMKHLAPAMIDAGGGSIVTVGSAEAFTGYSTAGYVASQAALVALTRNAAVQLAKHKIRVNLVCAGATATGPTDEADAEFAKRVSMLGRLAMPEEIANMALFAASDEASYATGTAFMVDGGWMAMRSAMTVK
jgi:NAD(P)-dependent dehydrogenase (short-subunit alcohol dehydrogenase family)